MPAVIDPNVCDRDFTGCFPARMCPEHAFYFDDSLEQVVIKSELCGTCPGPCTNFCDRYAIRYAADPEEFTVLKGRTLGTMSEAEAAEELHRLKQEAAEEEKAASPVQEATQETFDSLVLQSELPVVVDFWAPWCGPCQQMAPVFERLAQQYEGVVSFVKVNTDEQPTLAAQYGIQSLPTTVFFWNGQAVNGVVGALPESQLQTAVYQFLAAVQQLQQAQSGKPVLETPGGQGNLT